MPTIQGSPGAMHFRTDRDQVTHWVAARRQCIHNVPHPGRVASRDGLVEDA